MSLNPTSPHSSSDILAERTLLPRKKKNSPLILLVQDDETISAEMRQALEQKDYRVMDADNGLDAAKRARFTPPDLVVVDLDVPLLYGLVAARQIVKTAHLGSVPVVIVTREVAADPYPLIEVGVRRNEYVTRLTDHTQLETLLQFLLPVGPKAA